MRSIDNLVAPGRQVHNLTIENLTLEGRLTLAFKAGPDDFPVHFDLRIDGRPAAEATYLGPDLATLGQMPFTQRANKPRLKSRGAPDGRPPAPYFLVWLTEGKFRGETAIELNDETKRELRAIGYIQ